MNGLLSDSIINQFDYGVIKKNIIDFISAINLLSEFNIIFSSNISVDEAIKLFSQFNINFTSSISIDEVIKLLSEFNILFNILFLNLFKKENFRPKRRKFTFH